MHAIAGMEQGKQGTTGRRSFDGTCSAKTTPPSHVPEHATFSREGQQQQQLTTAPGAAGVHPPSRQVPRLQEKNDEKND